MASEATDDDPAAQQLALIRAEVQFELGLLHERVNALLAAEAFLTIAYTAAMSNGTPWGSRFSLIVSPILSVLGLLLAVLAWPGIDVTVRIVLDWTARLRRLFDDHPELSGTPVGLSANRGDANRLVPDQRRSMLFFRAVPILFVIVWVALTVVALALRR